ncbi:MAG: 50S ribosomal protein L5 [Candidatus Woesearchaeota archaeon]|nr:50S ribosomal protein L5 [Candidatus Woesearchaeota archaeon]MDP7322776.1 50S ribosomal protein L5 [Candidatus Woesearchaeota archaeon]MDP7476038.1 50S ribosomal protein L5 [Candidatus Woesearchaeota archaeon]HJO01906.1 50S ribosomal protein L5 [Candidatus Woesearchaeota archaeon]
MNSMKQVSMEKVTLNIGAGKDQAKLEKGIKLINSITGRNPVKTFTKKRIQEWGLRPGLPIGCKLTLRKKEALELLKRLFEAKDNTLQVSNLDNEGNISFGINEYIDIPGVKYDPDIGIMGLQVCITLKRSGFRVKSRALKRHAIPRKHRVKREDAIDFMKNMFNLKVGE